MSENKKQIEYELAMLYDVISKDDLPRLIEMIRSTAYGSVTITIQDRKAVQIEKNEKIRIR